MNRNVNGILTLVVLLSLFAGFRSSSGEKGPVGPLEQTSEPPSKDGRTQPGSVDHCEIPANGYLADVLRMLQRSLSTGLKVESLDQTPGCPMDKPQIPGITRDTVHVIVALVPDPVHTNLPLFFDRQIDALEQGAQDCGWIFEEALTPWDNRSHLESSDFRIRDAEKEQHKRTEEQPGLLIFRRRFLHQMPKDQNVQQDPCGIMHEPNENSASGAADSDNVRAPVQQSGQQSRQQRPENSGKITQAAHDHSRDETGNPGVHKLLVFVVAETPTSGIRKLQFRNAIGLITRLFGDSPPDVLRILGPTFSGSMQSLAELLLDCAKVPSASPCGNGRRVVINSGTVTGRESVSIFNAVFRQNTASEQQPQISFHTLQEYDENAESLFLKFACERDYEAKRIAFLSEDETAYGSKTPEQPAGNIRTGDQTSNCNSENLERNVVHLYFPRELSHLRSAYQKTRSYDASRPERVPRSTLPLDLSSSNGEQDTVTQYSGNQLPLSQEAVLLGIVAELRKHSIELVLVRATNPLDQLFLARYLRQAYPQGRVIIAGADLLFAREIQDAALHGVLTLTTYMLSPGEEHLFESQTPPPTTKHSDRVFSGSDAVGTYNAMTLLLVDPPLMPGDEESSKIGDETRAKFIESRGCPKESVLAHLAQYEWPHLRIPQNQEFSFRPPIHLSVLGHGGFWDLAILDPSDLPAPQENDSTDPAASPLPLVCGPDRPAFVPTAETTWEKLLAKLGPRQLNFPVVPNSWKLFGLVALAMSLTYLACLWSSSVLSGSEAIAHLAPPIADSRRLMFAVTAYLHFFLVAILLWASELYVKHSWKEILFLLALGITMFLILVICAYDLEERDGTKYAWRFRIAATLTIFGVIALWWRGYFDYMFMWRSVNLSSGVSPLLPVLLLLGAGLWGAWHTLSGSVFVDQRRPALPKAMAGLAELERFRPILEKDQKSLIKLLKPDHLDPRIAGIAILVMFAAWEVADIKPVRSLEKPGFEYFLAILIAIIAALLVATVCRLCGIWRELKRLLQALDATPLSRGFRKLKGFTWSPIWRIGAGSLGDFRRLLFLEYEARDCIRSLGLDVSEPSVPARSQQVPDPSLVLRNAYTDCIENWLLGPKERAESKANSQPVEKSTGGKLPWILGLARSTAPVRWLIAWVDKIKDQKKLDRKLIEAFANAQRELAADGSRALNLLGSKWQKMPEPFNGDHERSRAAKIWQQMKKTIFDVPSAQDVERNQVAALEEFLALLYTSFILIVIVRMRALVVATGGMYIFVMLALSIYPFQPQVGIRLSLVALLVFIVAAVGMVYAQMHRDATLSYITDTRPGELGGDFWIRIASFAALPLLSLAASQFPEISGTINSWIEPALGALK